MKAYSEYKDSGVEWLGKIPEHWGVNKLKFISSVTLSGVDKKTIEGEALVKLCNYTDVYYNDIINDAFDFMPASASQKEIERSTLSKDDVIITKDSETPDDIAVPSYVESDLENVLCGYHLAQIATYKSSMFGKYLFHLLAAKTVRDQYTPLANGITRYGVGKYAIDNSLFPQPLLSEQQSIVNYLDRKTQKIDTLIEKKQKMIELLKEERTAVINHAVTKGLNPDVNMKDSGIEWLGEIPEHWEMRKLKFISTTNDDTLPESTDVNYEIDYVDIGSVSEENGIEKSEVMIFKDAPSRARRKVQDGDVIVSTVRTYLKAIAFIKNPNKNLIVSTGFAVIRPMKKVFDSQYAAFAFHGTYLLEEVVSNSVGVSYPAINSSSLINIKIPMAALDEQQAIANYLDQKTRGIDSLIERNENSIEFLQEYRTALISEAVTGKIDVRDEVMA